MDPIELAHLSEDPVAFDAAVAVTPRIDRYCSSSAWVLPAHAAFHADNAPLILRSDAGWAALCAGEAPTIGRYLAPLESMWGLACPLVGDRPERLALDFYRAMFRRRRSWDALWIAGLDRSSDILRALASLFATTCAVRWGPVSNRYSASLAGGWEGWLARRSSRFRTNLRRDLKRTAGADVTFERVLPAPDSDPGALYRRILAVEARSWKGLSAAGINSGAMRVFYDRALALLIPRGALRAVLARRGDEDVGYIFGGIFGDTYRGLQVSFDERLRGLGLGNALQSEMIRWLGDECVRVYDLGSEITYKARWSEPGIATVTMVILRR